MIQIQQNLLSKQYIIETIQTFKEYNWIVSNFKCLIDKADVHCTIVYFHSSDVLVLSDVSYVSMCEFVYWEILHANVIKLNY